MKLIKFSRIQELNDKDWLEAKYFGEQLPARKIAELIGSTKYSVCRALKRFKLPTRRHTSRFKLINDKEWLRNAYEKDQLSIRDLAKLAGTTMGNVRAALVSAEIPVRTTVEGLKIKYPQGRFGNLSSNWRNGISKLTHLIRSCKHYRIWRNEVLERNLDIEECQNCNSKFTSDNPLEVDHKIPFRHFIRYYKIQSLKEALNCEPLWDVTNGRLLCKSCNLRT